MAKILLIRRKTLSNQSINQSGDNLFIVHVKLCRAQDKLIRCMHMISHVNEASCEYEIIPVYKILCPARLFIVTWS